MNDLKSLLSTDATDFERQLLGAAAQERPSPELELRMQRALGLAPVAGHLPGTDTSVGGTELGGQHAAVKAAASHWARGPLFQAVLGVGVGAGLVAGALALRSREPAAPLPAPAPVSVAAPSAPRAAPAVTLQPTALQPTALEPTDRRVEASRELREEVDLLDRVRVAVSQGDASAATALLDGYAARFPEGTLSREAGVLRARTAQLARTR